jgi:hypothetical protein
MDVLVAGALISVALAVAWLSKVLYVSFFTSQDRFWTSVAEDPEGALALFAAENECLIDPSPGPSRYLGPFLVMGHRVYLPFEHADAIKARVAQKLKALTPQHDPDFLRRSVKFASWKHDDRPGSVPILKWWAGFDWNGLVFLLAALTVAAVARGPIQIFAATVALLSFLMIAWRTFRWNRKGWAQVHHRAMLVYADIARSEDLKARRENRTYNRIDAWTALGVAIAGRQSSKQGIDAMIHFLDTERGAYFARLVERHGAEPIPDDDARVWLAEWARNVEFGPQLVIGHVVENTFGGAEAARYALALIRREAP